MGSVVAVSWIPFAISVSPFVAVILVIIVVNATGHLADSPYEPYGILSLGLGGVGMGLLVRWSVLRRRVSRFEVERGNIVVTFAPGRILSVPQQAVQTFSRSRARGMGPGVWQIRIRFVSPRAVEGIGLRTRGALLVLDEQRSLWLSRLLEEDTRDPEKSRRGREG